MACKKRRRDDDRSSCRTITKYLSPVGKTGDSVFSPPKSSNILNYFRKTYPPNEKTQSARECRTKSSAPLPADSGKDRKTPLEVFSHIEFKKRGKRINLSHRLINVKAENESPIEVNSDDSKEDSSLKSGFVESSTSVSLSVSLREKRVEVLAESIQDIKNQSGARTSIKSSKKVNPKQGVTKNDCQKMRKRKHKDVDLSESLPLAEEPNLLPKDGNDPKQRTPSPTNEVKNPASGAASRGDTAQPACLSERTVTVSYEEFLKSHKEDKVELPDSTVEICMPSETVEDLVKSGCMSDPETCEMSRHVHSKTVTVHAQVHPVPPKKTRKIPSIFLKQKQLETESSLSDPENETMGQKRKSNVVIREEELELAVLEAGGSEAAKPKCTVEERQQFMKAFRQPASDVLKNGARRSADKQKELSEKSLNDEGRDSNSKKIMDNPNIQMISNYDNSQSHPDKGTFPTEKINKLKKKGKKMLDTGATPGESRQGNTQKKGTAFSFKGKQNQNRLRMSLRQKKTEVFKNTVLNLVCEDLANDPLKIASPHNKKSSRKTSVPVKDKFTHSKAETEDSLENVSTPKSSRRSVRTSSTPIAIVIRGTDSEDDSPVKASTPKTANFPEKHSLYTAELITISSDSESPIRMKFTRISTPKKSKKKSKKRCEKSEATDGDFTSQTRKASSASKSVSKAKQLIEKAKALHISRSKTTEEIVMPLRRSSRHQTLPGRKELSETADSVIIDSDLTSLQQPEKNQKKLQCLNDVLGKKLNKNPKNVPGKVKVAPLFLTRKAQKTADFIPGFEENSQDTSEKSQDCDVQFKAKRDFLMSGLPDLLKRQIAKKAAVLDVYNAASTSFQRVVHIQQKDDGCHLWHLKPPTCPLLTKLKELDTRVIDLSKCVLALGEFSTLNSNSKSTNSAVVFVERRQDLTEEVRNVLLEEIRSSNPEFSLMKYFSLLLKKRNEHQVLSVSHRKQESPQLEPDVNQKETKRKRVEMEIQKSKRKKPNEYAESPKKINGKPEELDKRNNSTGLKLGSCKGLSKPSRKKQAALSTTCKIETAAPEDSDVLIIDDGKEPASERAPVPDSGTEDMLWTEKYQPQNSRELIGNELAIKKLHSWLKDWKRRAELEERQNLKGKKDEKQEDLSASMDYKGSSDDEENRLCNTVLITGPTGVGKTAAVYACAQELGFKIFEVNASSQRSGRQILSQLKEATQSHQVDKQGVNSQKPCFFNSYNLGKSPKKLNSPKKVITSPRKLPPPSPQSSVPKRTLPPKTLANYFKVSSKPKNNEGIVLLESNKGIKNSYEQKPVIQTKSTNTTKSNVKEFGAEESNRKNATSLILFEEVDVIFEEDAGFLNAIKTFMATTKRPVILTTSDPTFSLMFDGCFEEINFSTPPLLNVASYLQMICLAENFRTDVKDFVTLLTANSCDIRKSILYLQFWIRSGGGVLEERPLSLCRGNSRTVQLVCSEDGPISKNKLKSSKRSLTNLPKCDTGCVETLFGLKNIFSPSEDLFSFLKHKIRTKEEWYQFIQLLAEFRTQNVDFIYSNLEFILPLPVNIIPETENFCGSSGSVDTSVATKNMKCLARKRSEGEKPLKKPQKKKQKKKMVILDDSDLFDTEVDFSNEFLSPSPASSSSNSEESKARDKESNPETKKLNRCLESNIESVPCPPKTPAGKACSALVSHCLNSLTEFMDNMSFLDALLNDVREQKEFGKRDFSWTNVKSGLCDEFSLETSDGWTSPSSGELKAGVEALSFAKCSSTISKALETSLNSCKKSGRDPTKELTFYVSQKRSNVYFSQSAANLDSAWKRIAVIKSVFSSRSLLNLGNRQASIIEYLPTLRNICKTEKLKEQGKSKRRFLHYLEGIHLNISKETVNTLAAGFP
ncbi:ATPase family AAA domain-containing protein 5 isoform X2 [Suricata suricatta]|uniref:ATPase family AAA domain-containing protein 5 n=1 Tax=Suricata suricatta TaxID=37032 RepID=A0A673VET5_SURSU|nr:ATPase family AAA domain-containing protein 5 isoform X2 [Suricata suricatta]XP_029784698.1 ATPase family AAA domain-containing protein 5 isoform X2 [Suricata suricatta]